MNKLDFTLKEEYIELNKLLKILCLVESGGQANQLIIQGKVLYNGEIDLRKRLKLKKGDEILFLETLIKII
ncbi:MAG: RNA-binding protein [Flavobacteriales bacterium]|nr:RNA-binding protein [Flavobacteriales bacterium]|tara:strand:+ start:22594 stop:22806 length:213 start_codon:yes stop_codon:yes gene_type:complete